MKSYRVTAMLNEKQITIEVKAVSENHAWLAACSKHIPERLYNGKVEELPTRDELTAEIARMREALENLLIVVGNHTGEEIKCDTITEKQWIAAARTLRGE